MSNQDAVFISLASMERTKEQKYRTFVKFFKPGSKIITRTVMT